jgi:Tfp pilus assembly protein PilN
MNFFKDKIRNLSLIKIAGIKKFAVIEIYSNQIKFSYLAIKDRVFGAFNNDFRAFEVLDSFNIAITDSPRELENNFLKLFEKVNKKDTYFVLSTSQCRTKIFSVPKTFEDIGSWFDDNKKKLLPEINNLEQFVFSYEVLLDDEDSNYIALTFSRKDHIDFFESLLSKHNVKMLVFTSFNLVLNQFKPDDISRLSLILLNDKAIYSYYDNKKDLIIDELFLPGHGANELANAILQIKENIFTRRNKNPEHFEVILNCDNLIYESAKKILLGVFGDIPINVNYPENKNEYTTQVYALKKIIKNYDNCTNLIEPEKADPVRGEVEKSAAMHIILMLSSIIMLLLIILNVLSISVQNELSANEEFISKGNGQIDLLARFDKEKAELSKKIFVLNNLKWNRAHYSYLLYLIADVLSSNTILTSLQTDGGRSGVIALEMEGCAQNQEGVSSVLYNLERKKELSGVSLSFSNIVNTSEVPNESFAGNYVKFKITCNLNDNKK